MRFDSKLLIKYLIEELSEEELAQIIEWRSLSKENEELFTSLTKLRVSYRYANYSSRDRIEKSLLALNQRIDKKRSLFRWRSIWKYAAIGILLFALSFGGWQYFHQPDTYTTITVGETGEVKKVTLADGTLVWLNSHSSLRIPASFSAKNRKVNVEGEVYFDVKKNLESPFLVDAGSINLKVMGTSFNVNTRKDEDKVETMLVTGKVLLVDDIDNTLFEMSPGEKVTFSSERNELYVESVDVNVSTAWHLSQLTFESVTLREIVNKLSIIYDININLESKTLAERRFRCVINRDESLAEVLEILTYLAHIQYRIEGNEVFISEKH